MFSAEAQRRIIEELGTCIKTVYTETVILEFYCIADFMVEVWRDVKSLKQIRQAPVNDTAFNDFCFSL